MIRTLSLLCFLATTLLPANPIDSATIAAMRLAEASSYSWTCAVEDDARSYVKQGKHTQAGYTWVTLPMIDPIARRLGRAAGAELEAIFHGNNACVIRVGQRWKTVKQLPRAPRGSDEALIMIPSTPLVRTPDRPADTAEPDLFPSVIVLAPPKRDQDEDKPFSNARLAASPPHEELALIVSSWANVTTDDQTVRGTLSDTGARLLLCPGNETDPLPLIAAGEFTLFLKDNVVRRYQLQLGGVLLVGKRKILVRQSSETSITDIGTTKFEVSDEARLKLQD